jgi:hypothetical protein
MQTLVDPYRVVNLALAELAGDGHTGPYTGRQLGEAAVLAAALLAALGAVPAVDGDTMHPTVIRGLELLEQLRAARADCRSLPVHAVPSWPPSRQRRPRGGAR